MTRRGTLLRIAALALVTAVAMWPLACARAADDATAPAAAPTAGAAAAAAQPADTPVTVRARLDPDTTTIGTPFRYTMEITGPPGLQIVFAQPTERLGEFDIRLLVPAGQGQYAPTLQPQHAMTAACKRQVMRCNEGG